MLRITKFWLLQNVVSWGLQLPSAIYEVKGLFSRTFWSVVWHVERVVILTEQEHLGMSRPVTDGRAVCVFGCIHASLSECVWVCGGGPRRRDHAALQPPDAPGDGGSSGPLNPTAAPRLLAATAAPQVESHHISVTALKKHTQVYKSRFCCFTSYPGAFIINKGTNPSAAVLRQRGGLGNSWVKRWCCTTLRLKHCSCWLQQHVQKMIPQTI